MKKLFLSLATLSGAALLAIGGQPVHAADDSGDVLEGNSNATFTIDKGKLELKAVPDMDFGHFTVPEVVKGATNPLTNTGGALTVSDFRGSDTTDWSLSATTGAFKHESKSNTINGTIDFTATNDDGAKATGTLDGAKIWTSADAKTSGVSEKTVNTTDATTLTLSPQGGVVSGKYTANVTWTLDDTPTASQAS